jgi:catechol 2,3-dioxygenase-like lactoylglutathione lyase family enzyme
MRGRVKRDSLECDNVDFEPQGAAMGLITALDHVQVAMPVGAEDIARAFYGELLGLTEIPKPANLALRGGVWFQVGAVQLHMGADPVFQAARKAHPALVAGDLPALSAHLEAGGVAVNPEETVDGRARATISDPFGNRVELIAQ